MAEGKKEPKVEGGFNIDIAGLGLGNLLGGLFGNIEELLDMADRLADTKGNERAKEDVRKMREGLGKTEATREDVKAKGLGGLLSQILNFVEKASKEGGEFTQEFAGGKGIISSGVRGRILGREFGEDLPLGRRAAGEKFEVRKQEPKAQRTEKKPRSEEEMQPNLDVFDEKDHILIIGDMPGVTKEDIKYELKEKTLRIYTTAGRKYEKEIPLPSPVTQEVKWSYKNGILEVTLTKK